MIKYKLDDTIQLLVNDEVVELKCSSVSSRKSLGIISDTYWFRAEDSGWSVNYSEEYKESEEEDEAVH